MSLESGVLLNTVCTLFCTLVTVRYTVCIPGTSTTGRTQDSVLYHTTRIRMWWRAFVILPPNSNSEFVASHIINFRSIIPFTSTINSSLSSKLYNSNKSESHERCSSSPSKARTRLCGRGSQRSHGRILRWNPQSWIESRRFWSFRACSSQGTNTNFAYLNRRTVGIWWSGRAILELLANVSRLTCHRFFEKLRSSRWEISPETPIEFSSRPL